MKRIIPAGGLLEHYFFYIFIRYVFSQKLLFFECIFLCVCTHFYVWGISRIKQMFGISLDYDCLVPIHTTIRSIIMTILQRAGGLKEVLVANSGRCRFRIHSGFLWCFRDYGMP